jgi:hypothetical protein
MAGELQHGDLNLCSFIGIEDQNHELVMTVQFAEAVRAANDQGSHQPKSSSRTAKA